MLALPPFVIKQYKFLNVQNIKLRRLLLKEEDFFEIISNCEILVPYYYDKLQTTTILQRHLEKLKIYKELGTNFILKKINLNQPKKLVL